MIIYPETIVHQTHIYIISYWLFSIKLTRDKRISRNIFSSMRNDQREILQIFLRINIFLLILYQHF